MLKFSRGNAKLAKLEKIVKGQVWSFSTLSGICCPYAKDCKSQAVESASGKLSIQDGPHTLFRCFSASQEAFYRNVYNSRKHNMGLIAMAARSVQEAANCIVENLPAKVKVLRINVGGDFSTQNYFDSWLEAAKLRPDVIFYAYTKSLPFWVKRLGDIPTNLVLTASYGGYKDELIEQYGLRYAKVVFSKYQAKMAKLPIDHDDSHAYKSGGSFALLVHGIQPKGSSARKAMDRMGGLGGKSSYQK